MSGLARRVHASRPMKRAPAAAFLSTAPLRDVELLILLFPLWWVLGVEQWIPTVILAWSALKLAVARRRFVISWTALWMSLLLGAMVASSLFIVETERYVTFARNLSVHLSAFLVLIVVLTEARSWRDVRRLLRAVAVAMAIAGVVGAIGFTRLADIRFASPFGALLPAWIRATDYGGTIAVRSIGSETWFAGLGSYVRVDSMFLFSTMYAAALALTIPVVAFLVETSRGSSRLAWASIGLLLLANLVFTTGRVSTLALLAGAAFFALVRLRALSRVVAGLLVAIGLVSTVAFVPPAAAGDTVETVVLARGSGSLNSRLLIYRETLEGVARRPALGWGTERDIDVEGFKYPAGSHSFYLATLYRHGAIGFMLLALLLASSWRGSRPVARSAADERLSDAQRFLYYGRWSLVALLVLGLTTVPDVDAFLYLMAWTVLGSVLATRRIIVGRDERRAGSPHEESR